MSTGFSLLVHQQLGRAAELVQALHAAGGKIAIHVDAKVPDDEYNGFQQAVASLEHVVFSDRVHCEWGRFSLVKAQLLVAKQLLERFPDVEHVMQISGSCLPNRPLPVLFAFLEAHKGTDFIESVTVGGMNWIKGGLEAERFSLYFPLSFEKHRRRFDALVWLQRKLRVKRKMPAGLTPHIGSQWWTLSRTTLQAILQDPMRQTYNKFFSACWIPDEIYFQTLARKHSKSLKSRSLTYARFDFRGKPMVFYNDHARFIKHIDSFFVRKIWHGADALYETLLTPKQSILPRNPDMAAAFQAQIDKAESRWLMGRDGLFMQGRVPRLVDLNTATPYTVLSGFDRIFSGVDAWLHENTGIVLHQDLWSKNKKEFARAGLKLKRNMASSRRIRDTNAEGFLLNFVWNHADDDPIFYFDPNVSPSLAKFMAKDHNARVFHIRSAWLLDLFHEDQRDLAQLRPRLQKLALNEQMQLEALKKGRAKVEIISLADVYAQPGAIFEDLLALLRPHHLRKNHKIPAFRPHDGLEDYIEFLENAGIKLNTGLKKRALDLDKKQ